MKTLKIPASPTLIPWRLLGGLLLGGIALGILFVAGPFGQRVFDNIIDILSLIYSLLLALLCFKGSPRLPGMTRLPAADKQVWRRFIPALLGVGVMCVVLGQLVRVSGTLFTQQEPTYPAPHHFIYLAAYLFFICAFLLLPSQNLSLLSRLRILIDSLLIIITVATLYCYYILVPILVTGKGTLLEKIVGSIFPAADLILLFCLLLVALRSGEAILQRVILLLALSVLSTFIGHVIYLVGLLSDQYTVTIRANVSILFGLALVTVAAQTMSRVLRAGAAAEPDSPVLLEETGRTARWKTVPIYLLVLIFGILFSVWMPIEGGHYSIRLTIADIGGALILTLLVLRQFLAMHEMNRLRKDLRLKNDALNILNAQLDRLATTDPLTGLLNHRTLAEKLDQELARAREKQCACSIIFMDIDRFKAINDQHGHTVGDMVLSQFAELVSAALCVKDCLGRWGGEEFVAILPGKGLDESLKTAEQIRAAVAQHAFPCGENLYLDVTCSLGIASYPQTASERESLITHADQAMYAAKRLGRNQTRTAHDPQVLSLPL